MSTNVIRPGVATKQTPSGKNLVMLVAGVAVAIAVGFAFYTSQSQDVTVSGVESSAGPTVTDTWLVNRQNAVNSANDQAAAYETARITAMGETYATSQSLALERKFAADAEALTTMAAVYATSQSLALERKLAADAEALTTMAEAYATSQSLALERKLAADAEALTTMAAAYARSQSVVLHEINDHIVAAQNQVGGNVNPAFGHEFDSEQGSSPSGSRVTVPAR